jgi:RNA-binding protein
MSLTGKQKKYLRSLAHHKPVIVSIGNAGLTDGVLSEIASSLQAHELLKIKLPGAQASEKKHLLLEICDKTGASYVQLIGRVGVIYRPGDDPKIVLP